MNLYGMGYSSSQKCASLGGAGWCFGWTQVPFSLASFLFTRFRKPSLLFECLMSSVCTFILARILPLAVYNDAHGMLGDIVDPSGFAMVTHMGHSFMNSSGHFPDGCNITLLVDLHVRGQRSNSVENIASAPPLSVCVCHFGELLEDGCSSHKWFFMCIS